MSDHASNWTHVGDALSYALTVGVLAGVITPLAALATFIWTTMRIYEMVTGTPFSQSKFAKWITGRA